MKNKQTKGLSLSANPISLIRGTFFAATEVFTEFFYKISKLSPRLSGRHYTTLPIAGEVTRLLRCARNDDRVWGEVGVPLQVKGNNKQTGTKSSSPAPVILGLVPKIFRQRVSNLVRKLALLLHEYRFTQDSRNKSENDWCQGRLFSTVCKFFKYPSPANKSAATWYIGIDKTNRII